ncbi:MAG: LOG family protein [Candidatus Omnitrophica bacterium]|nr:LOG family protein [Candidatus Omnitrophota bacterium]
MKSKSKKKTAYSWLVKAYKNKDFLNSPSARLIRILSEMIEPAARFRKYRVRDTVVFFGSSRIFSRSATSLKLKMIKKRIKRTKSPSPSLKRQYEQAKRDVAMSRYYEDARLLAKKLTHYFKGLRKKGKNFVICSGGGPGIMAAGNQGAKMAGGKSVGLNISIPMEQYPNLYQTKDLAFEFHYFFIRKFWFFYLAKALVVFPGGYGTMDELFELLTLTQTGKHRRPLPVILFGRDYWQRVINFDEMYKWGTISKEDLKLFKVFDDVDETFNYLKKQLTKYFIDKNHDKGPF